MGHILIINVSELWCYWVVGNITSVGDMVTSGLFHLLHVICEDFVFEAMEVLKQYSTWMRM